MYTEMEFGHCSDEPTDGADQRFKSPKRNILLRIPRFSMDEFVVYLPQKIKIYG